MSEEEITATEPTPPPAAPKVRLFRYGDQTWFDPGSEFTNDDIRHQLTSYFPELANADVRLTDLPDGRVEVQFIKRAGTKGGR